ncbi:septum formation protein Maf [Altericroceibacterium spongiae]|uniref:Nucleoside triphosphate pyrophosphatase n=1 Tax=Altericroceibacterium spongiae TaxID=2320269 RepID=A0A420EEF6_9SPHN|nr:nucleoside triphosphate pyrophosphatase [Altericroceibacterium spongiae]RKF19048.1 septum formation protein Maf [Altericroceibacterium spongiae]
MIILASQSGSRKAMLEAAGVSFEACPAHLDERALEESLEQAEPPQIALMLAEAKALAVSANKPEALVLGSDSLVSVKGRRFDKPASREEAEDHLRFFSGKVMELHSAAALARGNDIVWSHHALARLHCRELSDAFISSYLDAEWPQVSYCVGVFRIEALGVQLFERIEGDHFTVLGMPLLAVLSALRDFGELLQ